MLAFGAVSFFTDISTEMIYPLIPLFLSGVLGANATFVGAIEGTAETVASLLKLASGWISDKVSRRKALVVAGYALASFVRPFTAIAQSATQVLAIRVTDRIGKGIRSSPRDALLADSVSPEARGRAFGFHSAADNAGAVIGPMIAFFILRSHGIGAMTAGQRLSPTQEATLRNVFWWAAVPAFIALIVLVIAVRDVSRKGSAKDEAPAEVSLDSKLSKKFWYYLGVVLVFTLGNSTDAFLLLRANQLGVPLALTPVLWASFNAIKAAVGTYASGLSDRVGRKPLIVGGWIVYAAVYFGFAKANAAWQAWALFAVYGLFYAMTEGTERALVADIVPSQRRGTAFGWYNLSIGLGALPASLIFGAIWDRVSPAAAFAFGATLALIAAAGMAFVAPARATAA
ncbi:MAG: MFS transporter [Gemmatimonadota bacterium]|nr:MFS transporter [Gemmatimonadota bacterium]